MPAPARPACAPADPPAGGQRLLQPQGLEDLLLYRLNRLQGAAGRPVLRLCEGVYGITRREWAVLALLAQQPGVLSSELALRVQLDRARTSRAVSSLVDKRLVLREVGPADRRQVRLALTEAGWTLYGALFPQVREINHALMQALTPAEADQLDGMVRRLQQRAAALAAQATGLPTTGRHRGGRARARPG